MSFSICPKPLTKLGMKGCYLTLDKMGLMINFYSYIKVIWLIERNVSLLMVLYLNGVKLNLRYPKAPCWDPLLFLIYINDLEKGIKSHINIFADDTSLFSTVKETNISALDLNHDLFQGKMNCKPDPSKTYSSNCILAQIQSNCSSSNIY